MLNKSDVKSNIIGKAKKTLIALVVKKAKETTIINE